MSGTGDLSSDSTDLSNKCPAVQLDCELFNGNVGIAAADILQAQMDAAAKYGHSEAATAILASNKSSLGKDDILGVLGSVIEWYADKRITEMKNSTDHDCFYPFD
ncbi:hypothetical protein ACOME3_001617 [Neoechinorhynchus agilis]